MFWEQKGAILAGAAVVVSATVAITATCTAYMMKGRPREDDERCARLERLLAAERRGRTTAERELRRRVTEQDAGDDVADDDEKRPRGGDGVGAGNDSAGVADASDTTSAVPAAGEETRRGSARKAKGKKKKEDEVVYPMRVLGRVRSCFSGRNGTPRQPGLTPSARSELVIRSDVNAEAALDGLEGFSHAWVLFVFHENTDLAKRDRDPSRFRAKIAPPMLGGARVGVFATRTPHRYNPLGLSAVRIARVEGARRTVTFLGADLVDGTPVLDIKPYHPHFDALPSATGPPWLGEAFGEAERRTFASVTMSDAAKRDAESLSRGKGGFSVYAGDPGGFMSLVEEVLALDMRSNHRIRTSATEHSVILDGVKVEFRIDPAEVDPDNGETRGEETLAEKTSNPPTNPPPTATGHGRGGAIACAQVQVLRFLKNET